MISREEIKEENRQTMICYLKTLNYSERKLKEKSYQELSTIYLNHNPPSTLLNQPITLDKDIEEIIHRLGTFKDSQVIYGGEWGELQDAIDVIQTQASEIEELKQDITQVNADLECCYEELHKEVEHPLQEKLNAIEEVVKENTISMTNEEDIHYSDIDEIKQIIGEIK